ncbi:pyridoxal-phosphate dependent enzyme [Methylocapsa sp. S129]|uniref:pyridoxal-phosphate dependent enzyme n=1 Tax=Methylocapsa sp. S129 TaxID=1641869 RepID=UPI00131EC153|nr:pyridoxal-phosphate dependent enzyme [Methylocapsa sp. S129]
MNASSLPRQTAEEIAAELLRLSPAYAPTPLIDLPELASALGVAQILAKDEGRRLLGSFKSLGGVYAGLRALARASGTDIAGVLGRADRGAALPALVCASDGNHGLAVAAAAHFAGAPARVYLHHRVPAARAQRIAAQGAEIRWVDGAYDDAVDAAVEAARAGAGILVADTSDDPDDPIVADVMSGYGIIAAEIRDRVEAAGHQRPTHLFVQAGVGGLACAMADGLKSWLAPPAILVVVEPEKAACVAAALAEGGLPRVPGNLETVAEMLSCGKASAPAMDALRRAGARAIAVPEDELAKAPRELRKGGGPLTTPSGATGLAGLLRAIGEESDANFAIDAASRILLIVSEAEIEGEAT